MFRRKLTDLSTASEVATQYLPYAGVVLLGSVLMLGCGKQPSNAVATFEPNRVLAYQIGEDADQLMDQAMAESTTVLEMLFGTPDAPRLPEFLADNEELNSLVDLELLQTAAGPEDVGGAGLYRKHCVTCHGVTGNGRGPTAALLDPYPRDYRLGKFKFKSTPIGTKPTKADIAHLIEHGIQGSSMVVIPALTKADISALTEYVVYLAWRGEVERELLQEAGQLYYSDGEVLFDESLKESDPELYEEKWELIQEFTEDIAYEWLEAEDKVLDVPARDADLVPDSVSDVLAALAADGDSPLKQSVARGKELFLSEKAACSKCHGKTGRGDGQSNDYDDWTKDWTKNFGVDPKDQASHIPMIARGALPARQVSPRNFEVGVFRGGGAPEQLYRRIALGIEGTPMPAAALDSDAIWDLVNFVRSLVVLQEESAAEELAVRRKTQESHQVQSAGSLIAGSGL